MVSLLVRSQQLPHRHYIPLVKIKQGPKRLQTIGSGTLQDLFGYAWLSYVHPINDELILMQATLPDGTPWSITDSENIYNARWNVVKTIQLQNISLAQNIRTHATSFDFTFDLNANEVVAYTFNDWYLHLRVWNTSTNSFEIKGPYDGSDPLLINDAVVIQNTSQSDVILFYKRQVSNNINILMRLKRDNFSVERLAVQIPSTTVYDMRLLYVNYINRRIIIDVAELQKNSKRIKQIKQIVSDPYPNF